MNGKRVCSSVCVCMCVCVCVREREREREKVKKLSSTSATWWRWWGFLLNSMLNSFIFHIVLLLEQRFNKLLYLLHKLSFNLFKLIARCIRNFKKVNILSLIRKGCYICLLFCNGRGIRFKNQFGSEQMQFNKVLSSVRFTRKIIRKNIGKRYNHQRSYYCIVISNVDLHKI